MVNIVAKREIACYEQFLLSHYVVRKLSAAEASECIYIKGKVIIHISKIWEISVNVCNYLTVVNILAKREIAHHD